jgi:hypothetical protein
MVVIVETHLIWDGHLGGFANSWSGPKMFGIAVVISVEQTNWR